jgi:hypothetical protein
VLRLDPQGEAVARRRSRTEREIEQLDEAIASLRALETATAAGSTERPAPGHRSDQPRSRPPDPGRLPLTRLELRLAERLVACRREIDRSRDVVDRRLRARRAVEADLAAAAELAATDLGHRTTIPFFLFSMGAVIVVIATFAAGQALAEAAPALGPLPDVAVWLSRVLVVVLAARQLLGAGWPHRSFSRARRAKLLIPQLEWQVSQLRQVEFDIRRSYNRARREAELRMQRILDRRAGLVPERPRFISPNRPERRLE